MANKFVRIGSMDNIHIFDDGDFDGGFETDDTIKAHQAPIAAEDVLRLDDIGGIVGNVVGPGLSVDNAVARWNGIGGLELQDSLFIVDDTGHVSSFGGNIKFPRVQVPSTDYWTLDDYEEDYYTATLTCGTSGTITVDPAKDQLAYTKIGRQVTVTGYITVSAISSPVGELKLNLPFPIAALTENAGYFAGSVFYYGINAIGTAGSLVLLGISGSVVLIREQTTTGTLTDLANHVKVSSGFAFGFSYFST